MRAMRTGMVALFCVFGLLLNVRPAAAVIERLYPLKDVLAESQLIFVAKVDMLDADKPGAVLLIEEDLKGKAAFRRLGINLKGDADAVKNKQTPQLVKRLAPKLSLVVFVTEPDKGKGFLALGYTNGTWFQMRGDNDGETVRWSFNHFEPYLRRTFKGSTEELKQTVADALSGKKQPPAPNPKDKPGLGPEVKSDKQTLRRGDKETPNRGDRFLLVSLSPCLPASLSGFNLPLAVIPSVLIGGPLAVLAMLFPTVFGGWKRWLALISVACTVSTLYFLQWLLDRALAGSWWGSPQALWLGMMLTILTGTFWAWRRQLRRTETGEIQAVPSRLEFILLSLLCVLGVSALANYYGSGGSLWHLNPQWIPVAILTGGALLAWVHVARLRWVKKPRTTVLASEVVMLSSMALVCAAIRFGGDEPRRGLTLEPGTGRVEYGEGFQGTDAYTVRPGRLIWTFRAPDKGGISSSPLVDGSRVYIAAAHESVFKSYGAVYCLDKASGAEIWTFHDDKRMKPVFSSPCIANGLLYIGEGFHQDMNCKLYCLRADTGAKVWEFPTGSHTESSPCIADGKVYCGAGDDGLYCLDAASGVKVWHFPGFHIDGGPVVANGRVFIGSGVGDVYKETALFCLDATAGKVLWKVNTQLPAWGTPAIQGPHVYFGIGNGRMHESDPNPAGALLCLEAETGTEVWRYPVGDGVLAKPVVDGNFVYFGCRDGNLYCLDRARGQLAWKHALGAPVVAAPAVARCPTCGAHANVFAVAGDDQGYAQLVCLGANEGRVAWSFDIAELARAAAELYSSPSVIVTKNTRHIFVGARVNGTAATAAVYCFEDEVDQEMAR